MTATAAPSTREATQQTRSPSPETPATLDSVAESIEENKKNQAQTATASLLPSTGFEQRCMQRLYVSPYFEKEHGYALH